MMKRLCLSLLLLSQLAWATPEILDRPGYLYSPPEMEKILRESEREFRGRGDQAGLLEVECRRLVPLLRRFDSSCPQRVAALREKATQLKPGTARARCYWVFTWDAAMRLQIKACQQFARMAVSEPGLSPTLKARWLEELDDAYCGMLDPEFRSWMIAEVAALQKVQPGSALLLSSLALQSHSTRLSGQTELRSSLSLAILGLAQKEGWRYEQVKELRWSGQDQSKNWPQLLRLAQGSDGLLRSILAAAPTLAEYDRARSGLKQPLTKAEVLSGRVKFLERDRRVKARLELVRLYQRQGDVEAEIGCRIELASDLRAMGHLEACLRQSQAALQCRLDHPMADPDWGQNRPGRLARDQAYTLDVVGRTHQELALLEQALDSGWSGEERDQVDMHYQARALAEAQGDAAGRLRHWRAGVDLALKLEPVYRAYMLFLFAKCAPPGQSQAAGDLLQRARSEAEKELLRGGDRFNALATLKNIYKLQGDDSAQRQLWVEEMQQARRRSDSSTWRYAGGSLLRLYAETGRLGELKAEALEQLAASDPRECGRIYQFAPDLAKEQDPEALVWADQGVLLAGEGKGLVNALTVQARVLLAFGRSAAALQALDRAQLRQPGPRDRLELAQLRAEALWKLGRLDEAVTGLRIEVGTALSSEEAESALPAIETLSDYQRQRKADWQDELERPLIHFQALGEAGQRPRRALLVAWMQRLAQAGQWERGREVLKRYPWGEGLDSSTQKMQQYTPWSDLLPPPPGEVRVDPASLSAMVDELRLGRPDLGQLLSLRSTNLKHLQARLTPNDTLVTYCSLGDRLYLLALRAEGSFWRQSPLSSAQLRELVSSYLQSLSSDQPGLAEIRLHSMLLEPVLTGATDQRLYLVPTGELWQLPFGALRSKDGRSAAAQAEIVLLSSGDLLRLADRSWQPYRLSQPLAIGAPSPTDLPGAFRELEEVSHMLPGCILKRGADATSEALYQPQQRWGLLHFASHAHYNASRPLESDIQLRDGPLKLKQLDQLSLAEHSLVTLSCCQGGDAKGQKLDEPVTLATGFSAAGAQTVVANLWQVDDEVARVFFTVFYRELAAGATPGASFRQAQEHCRQLYPKARDWAGFFLLGNPT